MIECIHVQRDNASRRTTIHFHGDDMEICYACYNRFVQKVDKGKLIRCGLCDTYYSPDNGGKIVSSRSSPFYICYRCLINNDRYKKCYRCYDYYNHRDYSFCPACYMRCYDCNNQTLRTEAINLYGYYYCYNCVRQCDRCNQQYSRRGYCSRCYSRCDYCNRILPHDDIVNACCADCLHHCNRCNQEYCGNDHECRFRCNSAFYRPLPIFLPAPITKGLFMGLEVEFELNDNGYDSLFNLVSDNRIYFKSDSSLNDGMELVTHPMSLKYHMEVFPWSEVLGVLTDAGYRSHDTTTCGLHVHMSRDAISPTHWRKADYFLNKHVAEWSKIARRPPNSYCHSKNVFSYDTPSNKDKFGKPYNGRYDVLNFTNNFTVEWRHGRGTLISDTLLATLEWLATILEYTKKVSVTKIMTEPLTEYNRFLAYHSSDNLLAYLKSRHYNVNFEPNDDVRQLLY